MKCKKGANELIWMVAIIALLLLFLGIYSGVWSKLFGKSASGIKEKLDSAGDYDKDNVINAVDKCPCFAGAVENEGCPYGYRITGTNTDKEIKVCPKPI